MTAQEINAQLYRPILSGHQYDGYFPNSTCSVTSLANGNTAVAIKEMAKWAKKYAHHCKDIAPVLESGSLENTVNNIQDFLYNHIQYTIDGENQNLKSPACSWASRKEGTDCKSYTIFGSAILLQLGIKHYLRRIKQEVMSDAYTHVYLVIPVNQNTGKINDGYYVIDGTIKYNTELPFTQKDDIYMEPRLAINGLAAGLGCGGDANCGCGGNGSGSKETMQSFLYNNQEQVYGLGADFSMSNQITQETIAGFQKFIELLQNEGVDDQTLIAVVQNMEYFISVGIEPTIEQVFTISHNNGSDGSLGFVVAGAVAAKAFIMPAGKISLVAIGKIASVVGNLFKKGGVFSKIFGSIDCIGGSAFGGGDLQKALDEQTSFVVNQVERINKAVFSGDLNLLAEECMLFLGANEETHKGMQEKLTQGWNSCTTKNLKTFIENLTFFKDYGNKALQAWLAEYFTVQYGQNRNYSFKSIPISSYASSHMNYHNQVYTQRSMTLELKPTTKNVNIYGFELNEILIKQGEQKSFNQSSFLQSLQEVVAIVEPPAPAYNNNSGNNNSGNNSSNNSSGNLNDGNNNVKQAGGNVGMILLGAVAVGAIVYGTQQSKGKPSAKPK